MRRRDFIVKSGTIVTMSMLLSKSSFATSILEQPLIDESKRPNPDDFTQPIMKIIALGTNAPSAHNTQSWKFKIIGDEAMALFLDEKILLPATDPPSRQLHMSAGAFIETAVLGANRLGYEANVQYFPEGYTSESDFGVKPIATITISKEEVVQDPLNRYIESRQTNRRKYKGKIVSQNEFEVIKSVAGYSHSKLIFKNQNLQPYFDLFYKGFEIESKTFRTNEETRNLFRYSEGQRAEKRDGISIPQMGYKGMIARIAERSLKGGDKEVWHNEKSIKLSLKKVKKGIESSKGLVFWYTDTNDFIDWVKSGRDYLRFSLALTQANMYAQPYNQIIQEYDEVKEQKDMINKMLKVKFPQKIQMIIRIGRSSEPYYSYRRKLDSFVVK